MLTNDLRALLLEARGAIFRYSPSGAHTPRGERIVPLNSADGKLIGRIDALLARPVETTPEPMTEQRALEILGIGPTGRPMDSEVLDLRWMDVRDEFLGMDGYLTADQLEALAWWMRNKGG